MCKTKRVPIQKPEMTFSSIAAFKIDKLKFLNLKIKKNALLCFCVKSNLGIL